MHRYLILKIILLLKLINVNADLDLFGTRRIILVKLIVKIYGMLVKESILHGANAKIICLLIITL